MSEDAIRVEARKVFRQLRKRLGKDRWEALYGPAESTNENMPDSGSDDEDNFYTPEGSEVERSVSPQVSDVAERVSTLSLEEQDELGMSG